MTPIILVCFIMMVVCYISASACFLIGALRGFKVIKGQPADFFFYGIGFLLLAQVFYLLVRIQQLQIMAGL